MSGGRTHKKCTKCGKDKKIHEDFKKFPNQPRYYSICLECQKGLKCLWCGAKILKNEFCPIKTGHKNCSKAYKQAQIDTGEAKPYDSQGQTARKTGIPDKCDKHPLCADFNICFETYFVDHKTCTWKDPKKNIKRRFVRAIDPTIYL